MAEVTGLDVAVGRHASRVLHRLDYRKPVFVGLLAGFDHYYNEGGKRIQTLDADGKLLYDFMMSSPDWQGVDGLNPDYTQRRLNIIRQTSEIQGKLESSSCQMGEPIDKKKLRRLRSEQAGPAGSPYTNYIKKLGQAIADKYLIKVQNELFPAALQVGGSQAYAPTADHMMAFAYPLQSGYANNSATADGSTYNYLGINLNDRTELKAINKGDTTTGWTVSERALQEDFIMPLRGSRESNVDMILSDGPTFSYLRQQLAATIQQKPERTVKFMGPKFTIDEGITIIYEPKLDALYTATGYREMYIGDSSTLKFGWDGSDDAGVEFIETWQEMPSAHLFQGYKQHAFVNERPDKWGRAFKVTIPGS